MSQYYLLTQHIKIDNANCISGPISYGFPNIGGILGSIHHLARSLAVENTPLTLGGTLIAVHQCLPKIYQPSFDGTFIQSRNPIKKDGSTASIIEEGKVNLNLSLVVQVEADAEQIAEQAPAFSKRIKEHLMQQRMAGGSVMAIRSVRFIEAQGDSNKQIALALTPSYILTDASTLLPALIEELKTGFKHELEQGLFVTPTEEPTGLPPNPQATGLDVLLANQSFFHLSPKENEKDWQSYSIKTGRGWLVPLPIGYQAISEKYSAGEMANLRNPQYASQYVETIYTLGKWVFSMRFARGEDSHEFNSLFWHYETQDNLYLYSTSNLGEN